MSKIRALELAADLAHGQNQVSAEQIVASAAVFAAFLGEEVPATTGKPRTRTVSAAPSALVADPETKQAEKVAEKVAEKPAETKQAATPAVSGVSLQDVKGAVEKLAKDAAAGGAPAARAILAEYGATNLSSLKPEHYAAVKTAIEAALEAADVTG